MLEASLLSITKKSLDNLKSDKIVGIRQIFQGETNLTNPFYLDNEYIKSLQLLADKNLVFDICVYADQLSSIITLVEKTPNNKYILDHIGKPFNINNSNNDKWFDNIFQLSKYQNVCCKLSAGFIMKDKTLTEVKIYVNHCIKCFGYDRLVVGSDWFFSESIIKPYDWFKFLLDVFVENHLPEHIIKNIFYDNALKIYSLKTNC
jgi:L-fuconolactonase